MNGVVRSMDSGLRGDFLFHQHSQHWREGEERGTAGGINVEANLLSPGGRGPRASFMTLPTLLFAVPVRKI